MRFPVAGIVITNGEVWKEQRKYCMNTAQELGLGLGHWEDLIMDEISGFIEKIQEHKGTPVDIYNYLMSSIISNIITLLIGRRLREPHKIEMLVNYTSTVTAFMGASLITSALPGLRKFCEVFKIAGYDKAAQYNRDFMSFLKEEINRHKTSPEFKDMHDFINAYLNKMAELSKSKNTNHFFSEPELEGNLVSLFLGATDTIFSSLGWLFRIMSAHKDIQEKVYQELMDAVGKDGRARYDERDKIPYTFAVLMEAQRYASNVPMPGNRIATDDIPIDGYVIPKGTEIAANLWALHRDPNYWDNPEKFRPERFLTADGTKLIKQPQSYAPFSVGFKEGKFLSDPTVLDGTAQSQANRVFDIVEGWGLSENIYALCFETTASYIRLKNGAFFQLENHLKRKILFLA
ncbi:Cytochrome P450 2U1 [Araneus ventricosus]|uniref:Cytochrome P450 2U1 n=1 Tax=Araneus ventricosus TaxID=182803 RepID=A0A4Y2N8K0_ARAVE|nr:Cytochrome P450 2U1 [Araneus ventricosus]